MKKLLLIILIILSISLIGCESKQIKQVEVQNNTNNITSDSNNSDANKNKANEQSAIIKDSESNKQNSTPNKTNTKNTQQINKTQEQKVSYKPYINDRFGFSIEYPSDFTVKVTPDNNDGLIFQSADGKTELTVSGINNVSNATVVSEYNNLLSQHSNAPYKKQEGNWFVVSWIEGNNIVYEKMVIGTGSENTFVLEYPTSQKDYYNAIVSHLVATFKNPGIDSGH